jgi:hypothetical protein
VAILTDAAAALVVDDLAVIWTPPVTKIQRFLYICFLRISKHEVQTKSTINIYIILLDLILMPG